MRIASDSLPFGNDRRDCLAMASATNCIRRPVAMGWPTFHQIEMVDSTAVDRLELCLVALAAATILSLIGAFVADLASLCIHCCWSPTIRLHALEQHSDVHCVRPDRRQCAVDLVRSHRLRHHRLWKSDPTNWDPDQMNLNTNRVPVTVCAVARATYLNADGIDAFDVVDAATQM